MGVTMVASAPTITALESIGVILAEDYPISPGRQAEGREGEGLQHLRGPAGEHACRSSQDAAWT
jgi:hypothetical protein